MHARTAALVAALAAVLATACAAEPEEPFLCQTQDDCARGTICREGTCQPGCLSDGDCEAGFCVDRQCVLRPPELCDCMPSSPCTETAPECQNDRPVRPCITDATCDDGNPCSIDRCVDGGCVYRATGDPRCCDSAADCDDGDDCTIDRCDAFRCSNARRLSCCTSAADCDDGDPCTRDFCSDGVCDSDLPHPDCCAADGDCDDGDPCTTDRCLSGLCVNPVTDPGESCPCYGTGDCDDGNPCTLDRCFENRCDYVPSGADGTGTGREITCCAGPASCVAPTDDTIAVCTLNICVTQALSPCADITECDDGDACTIDACIGGYCDHAAVAASNCCNGDEDCLPPNDCTIASCDSNRCSYRPRAAEGCCADVVECNDLLACTIDECVSFACVHRPAEPGCCVTADDCDDGDRCTLDACGPDARCVHTVQPDLCCVDNAQCDDGSPCTDDRCVDGGCVSVRLPACCETAAECEDTDPCTDTACVQNECRVSYRDGCCASSAYCWDADPCTDDACVDGACVFTEREGCCRDDAACAVADPCLLGRCVAGACTTEVRPGCCHDDAECDDGDDVCTEDRCVDNACVHASTGLPGCCLRDADCEAADPCLFGTCQDDGECAFAAVPGCCSADAACDDDDYCTDDACVANACVHAFNGAEGCCEPFSYTAGWDGGDHGWILENRWPDVGWQVDAHRTYAGTASLYYGDPPWYNYVGNPPTVSHGTATSPPLALPPGQPYRLRLYVLVDVRSAAAFDRFEVRVVEPDRDDRETVLWTRDALAAVGGTTGGVFLPVVVSLDVFAGETIRLRLAFDSVTAPAETATHLEGVYVDELSLEAVCPQ